MPDLSLTSVRCFKIPLSYCLESLEIEKSCSLSLTDNFISRQLFSKTSSSKAIAITTMLRNPGVISLEPFEIEKSCQLETCSLSLAYHFISC